MKVMHLVGGFLTCASVVSALAQGTLNFANFGGGNDYPILLENGARAQPADDVLVDLCYGSSPDRVTNFMGLRVHIYGNGYFSGASLGNFNPLVIPGFPVRTNVFVRFVAWRGATNYFTAISSGASPIVEILALGGGVYPPPNLPLGTGMLQLGSWDPPPPPPLVLRRELNAVTLSWRQFWSPEFDLETTTNLVSGVWVPAPIQPSPINGFLFVTNSMLAPAQFYRLRPRY